ncbi:hypothetical protein DF223_13170 [Mycetocola zhujimingii]|uniref:HNH endonuclease n=1 Tax=Mycetocola zhujimingii TaxID=2079792 RepID=A0A2U1TB35_9MICO|nr:hypothetical protein DF223_13170 [Mycetocola zhujimingii]
MTEAHHINEWVAHEGCTDLADGILLCPYHHTLVHTFGYRVVRIEGEYYLIPPPGENGERIPIRMPSKSPLEKERLRLAGIKAATEAADAAARAAAGRGSAGTGIADGAGDRAVRPGGQGPGESSAYLPTQHTRTA